MTTIRRNGMSRTTDGLQNNGASGMTGGSWAAVTFMSARQSVYRGMCRMSIPLMILLVSAVTAAGGSGRSGRSIDAGGGRNCTAGCGAYG